MVLSTETFNQSVRTEYSEAVNARYTFQPFWVSVDTFDLLEDRPIADVITKTFSFFFLWNLLVKLITK